MTQSRGFTMVELIVTMMVIGIMAIAVVPRMSLLGGFDARGYADQVESYLRYAQKSALAQRRLTAVVVPATSAGALELCIAINYAESPTCPANCSAVSMKALAPPGGTPHNPRTEVATSNSGIICFFPDNGRASAGPSMAFSDTSGVAKTIQIEADTGYVH